MSIKHTKVSIKADTADATEIQPSDWNDDHVFVGGLDLTNNKIVNLATPTVSTDAATKAYVDANVGGSIVTDSNFQGNGTSGNPLHISTAQAFSTPGDILVGPGGQNAVVCRNIQCLDELQVLGASITPRDAWNGVSLDTVNTTGVTVGHAAGAGVAMYPVTTTNTTLGSASVVLIDQDELPFDGSFAIFSLKGTNKTYRITDGGTQAGTAWPFSFYGFALGTGKFIDIGTVAGSYSTATFMFDQNGLRSGVGSTGIHTWMLVSVGVKF